MSAAAKMTPLHSVLSTSNETELPARLRAFAQEIAAEISIAAPEQSEQLISVLIAELAMSAADQRRRAERQKHQMECITAAKARGVRFGRKKQPLPDDFDEYYQAWQDGMLSLREAAESCGMGKTAFHREAQRRKEQEAAVPQ